MPIWGRGWPKESRLNELLAIGWGRTALGISVPEGKIMHQQSRTEQISTATSAHPQTADARPTFRRPNVILPVPTPQAKSQHAQPGVPDTLLTREATGLLREFSTELLFNHSHRVFFWANELGRQTGQNYDQELLFVCAAFHDMGLLKKFSSAQDRFEVDGANAVRQFLEHHDVPAARIQVAWDAISLHTTPGIVQYKPIEVELLYNGVGLDVLGIGYEDFPADLRKEIVAQYPRVNFKQEIAAAFLGGFEHKTQTTEGTCNEDICSHFIRNYKRSNFYEQIQNSRFQNS
jgi:HD domain